MLLNRCDKILISIAVGSVIGSLVMMAIAPVVEPLGSGGFAFHVMAIVASLALLLVNLILLVVWRNRCHDSAKAISAMSMLLLTVIVAVIMS